jgi:Trk-type K+ transport system membrane component
MNLLLFIIILIISVVVVKLGAIAFELTGVNDTQAIFQAISCFTGTGFTTKEAELVVSDPQRRRIASVLMVLGKAGFVTLLATFANSLTASDLSIPYLHGVVPQGVETLIKVAFIVLVAFTIYKIITHTKLSTSLSEMLKKRIVNRSFIRPVSFKELLVATGGYGVSSVKVFKDSSLENRTLHDAKLEAHDIIILALERSGKVTTRPPAQTKITVGDKLICFGKLDTIRDELAEVHP